MFCLGPLMRCGVLHRWLLLPLLVATLLYGGAYAMASEAVMTAPAPPPPPLSPPVPLPPSGAGPLVLPPLPQPATTPALPAAPDLAGIPHVALLLPLESATFGQHAEAVRNGFLAAARVRGETPLPLRVYAVDEHPDHVVAAYRALVAAGARVVVGPLTRDGVTAIADDPVPVPTLALNVPHAGVMLPVNLYMLSLQIEAEARQAAQLAIREGRRTVLTVTAATPLLRRIHQAFVEEFTRLGGVHVIDYAYTTDPAGLARIKQTAGAEVVDTAFLALDFPRARLVRPYLDPLAIYATSQVHPGDAGPLAGFDLADVRFLDMPWLLEPDHPAVMAYPRAGYRDAIELERLYALGIDAFRLAFEIIDGRSQVALDGVTGYLTLEAGQYFLRTLTPAQFRKGRLVIQRSAAPRGAPR